MPLVTETGQPAAEHFRKLVLALKPTAAELKQAGEMEIATIRKRTLSGRDVDGAPFAPYSASYAKAKKKATGKSKPVNLYGFANEEHMLDSMKSYARGESIEIGFYGEEAVRARVHNEGFMGAAPKGKGKGKSRMQMITGGMPRRHFFPNDGLRAQDAQALEGFLGAAAEKRMATVK